MSNRYSFFCRDACCRDPEPPPDPEKEEQIETVRRFWRDPQRDSVEKQTEYREYLRTHEKAREWVKLMDAVDLAHSGW